MNTKNLNKEKAKELVLMLNKRIAFNNKLNAKIRKFRKENNITRDNFNGYWDEPTKQMIDFVKNLVDEQDWMPNDMRSLYLSDVSSIVGQIYGPAVNTYILKDLHDCEKYLKTFEEVENSTREENKFFKIERDLSENRLNLYFDYIPDEEERRLLKSNGFKWSPSRESWTRQLTTNAESSLKKLIKSFEELQEL